MFPGSRMYVRFFVLSQVLLARLTGRSEYRNATRAFCDFSVREQNRTPKGLLYIDKFGTLCHAANVAFICLVAADSPEIGDSREYRQFAKQQIDYMLGEAGETLVGERVRQRER